MDDLTYEKIRKKTTWATVARGWKPPLPPKERARRLADRLLEVMERQLMGDADPQEKFDQLFGTKGLLVTLPKLVELLEELAEPEGTAEETLSREDMALLREWLAGKEKP